MGAFMSRLGDLFPRMCWPASGYSLYGLYSLYSLASIQSATSWKASCLRSGPRLSTLSLSCLKHLRASSHKYSKEYRDGILERIFSQGFWHKLESPQTRVIEDLLKQKRVCFLYDSPVEGTVNSLQQKTRVFC